MPAKINIQEHLEDQDLDLSMLNLSEVPVKDIAAFPKATSLDLSNNCLTTLGKNFATSLGHLVKLDLAQNQLTSLPDNLGLLVNLKHLDLYNNQLSSLPLSVGNLKQLKWLDLKQNPLLPKLAQIAGPCLDSAQCTAAAKNVVELLSLMNKQVEEEKKRRKEQMILEDEEKMAQAQKKDSQQQTQSNSSKKKNKKKKGNQQTAASLENGSVKEEEKEGESAGAAGDSESPGESTEVKDEKSNGNVKNNAETPEKPTARKGIFGRILSAFGFLFTVLVLTICIVLFGLFILSLLDENYYNTAVKHVTRVNRHIMAQFPKPWLKKMNRAYLTSSKTVVKLTNRALKFGVVMVQQMQDWHAWVNTDETVQTYFETVKSGWQVLWIRISEMYRTIFV